MPSNNHPLSTVQAGGKVNDDYVYSPADAETEAQTQKDGEQGPYIPRELAMLAADAECDEYEAARSAAKRPRPVVAHHPIGRRARADTWLRRGSVVGDTWFALVVS